MTTRSLNKRVSVTPSLHPAARVNGTANGTGVDLRGYDAAMIAVAFGTYTDGTHTPTVQHSTDNATYTTVAASDLDGALTAVSGAGGANSVQTVGYLGQNRYVRVVMTVSGATTGALSNASVIAGAAHRMPVA